MPNSKIPTHLAIIPDGNRRWAKQQGLLPWQGHQAGAVQFQTIARSAFKSGVSFLTLWAASEDNLLKRSKIEIRWLVKIFTKHLQENSFFEELRENRTRFRVLGRGREIVKNKALERIILDLEKKTALFTERNLTILFGYDGRREMTDAMQQVAKDRLTEVQYNDVKDRLWTRELPRVDLVIRTGEEEPDWAHWSSGFMMWDTANAEFYFTRTFWPAFSEEELGRVLAQYKKRRQLRGA
ncbi:MAG: di-trans,poly-cis-decaprenylcistransferase [Candidatus Sungbacteria bacterium]|nr:di-trans,poly-cis-decaprenylcistransferase [Candidatus Sungbacteria bacterium]